MDEICLTPLKLEHSDNLLRWRSMPEVYRFMRTARAPELDEHQEWIRWAISSDTYSGWVICHMYDGDVGYCNLQELCDKTFELGIYIAPAHHGKGYGSAALELVKGQAMRLGAKKVIAEAKWDNWPALKLYRKAGFLSTWVTMELDVQKERPPA